jgi:hypothetical protein
MCQCTQPYKPFLGHIIHLRSTISPWIKMHPE